MTDLTRESLAAALTTIRGAHNGPDDEPGQPPCEWCQLAADQAVQALAALPSPAPEPPPLKVRERIWAAIRAGGFVEWDVVPVTSKSLAQGIHVDRPEDIPPFLEAIERAAQPAPDPELLKKIRVHLDDWNNGADPDICMQRIGEVVLQARESGGEPPNG